MKDTLAPPLPLPASLVKRMMALTYDLFILAALSMAYWAIVTAILAVSGDGISEPQYQPMQEGPWFDIAWAGVLIIFYWFFWMRAGQTVGMRAWRLTVISANSKPMSHRQCLLRIALGPIALGCAGLGYLWCLTNTERLALHDLATNTRVVFTPKPKTNQS